MRWPWQQHFPAGKSAPGRPAMVHRVASADQQLPACLTCGRQLGSDPEDEPTGDAGGPICGECNRSRNFDVMFDR